MQNSTSTHTEPLRAHAYDEKTLEMARRIIRLSMLENDIASGAHACAYSLALLNRIITHYDSPSKPLPILTSEEEDSIERFVESACQEIVDQTQGEPLDSLIKHLLQDAKVTPPSILNRKQRRARQKQKSKTFGKRK